MKKTVKKIFKVLGIVLGVILLVLIAYIIYLYASYHRIEDNLVLEVESAPDAGEDLEGLTSGARPDSASARYNTALTTGETYSALTYNLGFGAYTPTSVSSWTAADPPGQKAKKVCRTPYREPVNSLLLMNLILHCFRK